MSLSLRKPAKPARATLTKNTPQVTSIEEHKNIRGAPKNLYSSRNYSSQKDSSLESSASEIGMPFEEVVAPEEVVEPASVVDLVPADVVPVATDAAFTPDRVAAVAVAEPKLVVPPLREHSPKKLVLGVNDPQDSRSADEYLASLGLKVEYTVEGKKGNYVLVQTPDNRRVYVRVPKTRRVYNSLRSTSPRRRPISDQSCLKCESSLHTPYSALVRNATVKVCRPECVGVVFSAPHTGITTFADETGFESYVVSNGHVSNFPLPVLDFEDVQAHPKDSLQAVEKVHLRLERHLLVECDDHIESLVELYNDFQKTFTSFIQLSDGAFQACNDFSNPTACEQLLSACINLPEVLDRLQSAHEILQTNANSFK